MLTLHPDQGVRPMWQERGGVRPNILVGDYSYYDDPDGAERFEERNVLHHFEFYGDRLIIGRFVAIAAGTRFVMNGANHAMGGFSTYPFNIFQNGWEAGFDVSSWTGQSRGDTVVGNDVWLGMESLVMPGVTIGDGATLYAFTTQHRGLRFTAPDVIGVVNVPDVGLIVTPLSGRLDEREIGQAMKPEVVDINEKLSTHRFIPA